VKIFLASVLILFSLSSYGEPLKVVVLDTGFKENSMFNIPLCPDYHYDATAEEPVKSKVPPTDNHGHGTHVVSNIHQYAHNLNVGYPGMTPFNRKNLDLLKVDAPMDYCFVIVKYFDSVKPESTLTVPWKESEYDVALRYIETIPGQKIINISGGGEERNDVEVAFVKKMHEQNSQIIAAAGNENSNLGEKPKKQTKKQKEERYAKYYPAVEIGVTMVGAYEFSKFKHSDEKELFASEDKSLYIYKLAQSNYGASKIVWRLGVLYGAGLNNDIAIMKGTSQATSVETGLTIRKILEQRRADELRKDIEPVEGTEGNSVDGSVTWGPNCPNKSRNDQPSKEPNRAAKTGLQGRGTAPSSLHPSLRRSFEKSR
jgi:hypothetical protein